MLVPPAERGRDVSLEKGPNITSLPDFDPLPESISGPVLLKVGDDISTDEIMPAGARVLPFRSNIAAMAAFAFDAIDDMYAKRAHDAGDHVVVAGWNYGQGSSREHAAMVPRSLGLRAVLARSFARIHWQNLVSFGVVPLTFLDTPDYDLIEPGDILTIADVAAQLRRDTLEVSNDTKQHTYSMRHGLSARQLEIILEGSLLNTMREPRRVRS